MEWKQKALSIWHSLRDWAKANRPITVTFIYPIGFVVAIYVLSNLFGWMVTIAGLACYAVWLFFSSNKMKS